MTVILAVLTLVPTHYLHPARVKRFRALNIASAGVWLAASSWLVAIHPARPLPLVAAVLLSGGWFMLVGVLRSIRGADEAARA